MAPRAEGATSRVRVAAALLIAGMVAGPAAEHLYWVFGGTWGLDGADATTGIRVVAAIVVVLILFAVLVVLARAGLWQQAFVPERAVRFLAWGMAAFFLGHGLLGFAQGWAGITDEWWLYGPGGLVIGSLMLVVASSGGAWPRPHRPHRTLPSY